MPATAPRIYLDLAPELRELLTASGFSIRDVLLREGIDLPLEFLPAELPAVVEGERERGIGTVLMGTAALTLSIGAAAALVILALSKFYSEREHAPALVETYVEQVPNLPSQTGFDFGLALERLDGDVDLLKEQMDFFLTDAPELIDRIRIAVAEPDAKQLQLSAHRLKGLLSSYDHGEAAALARNLEFMGRDGTFDNAAALCAQLEVHVGDLIAAMKSYMREN